MSRILKAIQRLEEGDATEDRSVIPISEAIAQSAVEFSTNSGTESVTPDRSEAFLHSFVHRFDSGHEKEIGTASPHFGESELDVSPQNDKSSIEHRLAGIWEEYAGRIPSALVETWVMTATWKAAAAGQAGWVSAQVFDSGLPLEYGLAVALDVFEKIEQPLLVIDAERSGQLTQALEVSSGPDLVDVVLGQAPLETSVVPLNDNGLCFLPNKQLRQTQGLPNWADVHSLFQSVRETFGLAVVFCSMMTDLLTSRILRNCDDFWVWCREGHTSVRHVKEIIRSAGRSQRQAAGAVLVTM